MKAILYARFSPRPGSDACESIITQFDRLRSYCNASGWEIIAEKDDSDRTGATTKGRPGLAEALDLACRHKAVLLVYSLTRLARNTRDAIEIASRLDAAGADLASLHEKIDTTSAMGRFVFRMMASLAELEREQISERTSDGMQRRQKDGQRMSRHPPYGYTLDKTKKLILPDEQEQENLAKMRAWQAQGLTATQIIHELQRAKIKCRRGSKGWHKTSVQNILERIKAS